MPSIRGEVCEPRIHPKEPLTQMRLHVRIGIVHTNLALRCCYFSIGLNCSDPCHGSIPEELEGWNLRDQECGWPKPPPRRGLADKHGLIWAGPKLIISSLL